ncbi:MAG TPA: TonB-dependent receptor, partial [Pyrinomonadaceae bacterium]
MISRKFFALFSTVFLLALCSVAALAQSQTTGRIGGAVVDANGAAVAGAEVSVSSKATGEVRQAVTDESGAYIVSLLPPGDYRVVISIANFKRAVFDTVRVAITETTTVDAALEVGALTDESVTVTAVGPAIQSESPGLGRVVDTRSVSELPLATRNFTQILSLSPGTATYLPDNTSVGRNSQNISVNGARVTNNNFQINGIDANSMGTNSAPSLSVPAPETIQEFKVQTSLYDATFGRSGGGNVQAVTKSGSNEFHGGLYAYIRNDALNANNPFLKAAGVERPVLKRNIFGGLIGGPIQKDKMFFFASYQGTRERNGASPINSLSSNILISPGLTDDRSAARLIALYNSRNAVPIAAINPASLALLNAQLPDGTFLIPTPQTASGRYSGSSPSVFDEDQFNANIDYRLSETDTLSGKFFYSNAPQTLVLPSFLGSGPNVPGYGNFQQNNNRLLSLQYVKVFSPTIVNEARIGYNFIRVDATPEEPVLDSQVGISRANAAVFPGLPLINIGGAGALTIGTSPTIDVQAVAPSTTLADTLSITMGRHQIRAGAEFRYNENNYTLNFFTRGQINFLSFDQFLTGNAFVSVFGSGIGDRSLRAHDYNFFVQDDWKVTNKLTLNLGLRYELDLPAYDTRGRIATFDPALYNPTQLVNAGSGFVQAGNVIPEYDLASVPNVDKRVVNSIDPNNFAPRVGFAYSPLDSGRLVVRGGYGIFYSRTSFQYITLNVIAPPTYVFGTCVIACPGQASIPLANPFFPAPSQSAFPTFVPTVALSGTFFDRNLRTPYIQQYNASVQYELAKDYVAEAAYVGTHGVNLFRQIGINQARLASPTSPVVNQVTGAVITTNTPANAALRAPFQGAGISNFFQNQATAQSNYNSMQLSLTKRFSRGLQFLASYTFAKSIDNASGQGGGPGTGGVLNPGAVGETSPILGDQRDNRANRGVSDFDRPHRFVFSSVYDLPDPIGPEGSAFARVLLNDWQLGGIFTSMSGLPIDIVDSGGASLYGLNGAALSRPNIVGDPFSNVPAGLYFNPAAFARATVLAGQIIPSSGGTATASAAGADFGNVGRNILRGPRQINLDLSIIKRFSIDDSKNVEFRTEFFNLTNHVNFANPISDLNAGAASFGRIISASTNPRLIQFALKFNF